MRAMGYRRWLLAAGCALASCTGAVAPLAVPPAPPLASAPAPAAATAPALLDHVVWTSPGVAADAPLPLVVVLHGLGDTPERFLGLWTDLPGPARVVAARAPLPWSVGSAWTSVRGGDGDPAVLAAELRARASDVLRLIAEVGRRAPTVGRPVVSGFSQGAMVTFAVALTEPEALAGAVPIAGAIPAPLLPSRPPPGLATTPVRAFHGTADPVLAYAPLAARVDALVKVGADVQLVPFDGVEHTVPPEMRAAVYAAVRGMLDAEVARVAGASSGP